MLTLIRSGKISLLRTNESEENQMKDTTKKWLKAAGVRALRTTAQTAIGTIGAAVLMSDVNWVELGSASLLAGIISLLMSIKGLPEIK